MNEMLIDADNKGLKHSYAIPCNPPLDKIPHNGLG